jgi:hypothetical protein
MAKWIILFLMTSLPGVTAVASGAKDLPIKMAPAQKKQGIVPKPTQPAPKAASKSKPKAVRKGNGIEVKLARSTPIVIGGKSTKPGKRPDTGFSLAPVAGKKGTLALTFTSRNPNMSLSTNTGLVAQIYSDEEVEIEPSVITPANWPKNATKTLLTYVFRNAKRGEEYEVQGEVAYTVCHKTTKVCTPQQTTVYLMLKQ